VTSSRPAQRTWPGGLEPELACAVDVMFPPAPLTRCLAAFQREFPSTLLKFEVESSAVVACVRRAMRSRPSVVLGVSRSPQNIACETAAEAGSYIVVASQPARDFPPRRFRNRAGRAHSAYTYESCGCAPSHILRLQSSRSGGLAHLGAKLAVLRHGSDMVRSSCT